MSLCRRCGTKIQTGRVCSECELDQCYKHTMPDAGTTIIGPNDDPVSPPFACGECHAAYYGSSIALRCCGGEWNAD